MVSTEVNKPLKGWNFLTAVLEEDFVRRRQAFDNVVSFVGNKRLVGTPEQAVLHASVEHIKY